MQWTLKRILVAVAAAAALWFPIAQAEETETLLRWKNGDVLPGQLQESSSGTIHWASPYFLDDLVLDVKVLDSVAFRKKSVSTTEAFRVSALSGDVWIADLIGSDDETFLFSSERHGQFRVNRSAVYMLERQERPDFLFDGSQLKNWKLPLESRRLIQHFRLTLVGVPLGLRARKVTRRHGLPRRKSSMRLVGLSVLRLN